MTELDQLISTAFASEGKQEDVNKVYLTLLRSTLFLPVQKEKAKDEEEPFKPLFAKVENNYFVLVFDRLERLTEWAGEQFNKIGYVEVSGKDVISGLNEQVFLCLNYGTDFYKEFSPEEVKRLKTIVSRIEQLKSG